MQEKELNKILDDLLLNKLADWMTEKQRKTKIATLLTILRKKEKIRNTGTDFKSNWVLI